MNEYNMHWELVSHPEGSETFSSEEYVFTREGMYVFEYVASIQDEGNSWTGTMVVDTIMVGLPPDIYLDKYVICMGDRFLPQENTEQYDGYVWDTIPARDMVYKVTTTNEYCSSVEEFVVDVIQCELKGGYFRNDPDSKGVYVPNVFSPNGDGINDVYRILIPYNAKIASFSVYDRWGRHVTNEHPWVADEMSAGTYTVTVSVDIEGDTLDFIQSVILMK